MSSVHLSGFSASSNRRLLSAVTVALIGLAGWALGGLIGLAVALSLAVLVVLVPWWGQPAWSWALLRLRRGPATDWAEPITVANNRAGAACASRTVWRWWRCTCWARRTPPPSPPDR